MFLSTYAQAIKSKGINNFYLQASKNLDYRRTSQGSTTDTTLKILI